MSKRILIASITDVPGMGGVSYITRLLRLAVVESDSSDLRNVTLGIREHALDKIFGSSLFILKILIIQLAWKPGIIIFDHAALAERYSVLPEWMRHRYIVFLYDAEAWGKISPRRVRAIKDASGRIALSDFTRGKVQASHPDIGPINLCRPALLPNDEDNAKFWPKDEIALHPRPTKTALIIARIDANETHKGHAELLRAWPSVLARHPDAKLHIVGGGSGLESLKHEINRANLCESVISFGFIDEHEKASLLKSASMFVMPSRREGFGLVYLEAMRAGLPCVAGNMDAASETILDGVNGLTVNPVSDDEIAKAIIYIFDNPQIAHRMGNAGRRIFDNNFEFEDFKIRLDSQLSIFI